MYSCRRSESTTTFLSHTDKNQAGPYHHRPPKTKKKGLVACSESTLGEGFPKEIELLESFPDCQNVFCT